MSKRSITIESLTVEALARFNRITKTLPGAPNEVAKRVLDAGLDAGERMVAELEAQRDEALEEARALKSAGAFAEADAANAAIAKATLEAQPEAEGELEPEEL